MSITDEFIMKLLQGAKSYCVFILKPGPTRDQPDAEKIQWEHVRYLFELREAGKLSITCPVMNNPDLMGVGVLNLSDLEEAKDLLNQDPNVRAGRLVYEVSVCMGLPGDSLP